jgi:mRNA-degrading endonuclease toxin of MazEF toxin-antitoxin module
LPQLRWRRSRCRRAPSIPAGRGVPEDNMALANQLRTIDIAERPRDPLGRLDDELLRKLDRAILIVLFDAEMAS